MNGYLNNLTMRTLNQGNRVEPRLPALFESGAFESAPPSGDRIELYEEEVTTASEAVAPQVRAEEPVSREALSHVPSVMKSESEDHVVAAKSTPVRTGERFDLPVEPASYEKRQEDTAESLTVRASVQPGRETVGIEPHEIEDGVAQNNPLLEIDEYSNPSLERGGRAPLWPRSSIFGNKAAPGRRAPRSGQTQQTVLTPEPDQFQAQITFQRTGHFNAAESPVAAIELAQNEEHSETEERLTNQPELEPEFESTTTYRRPNPTPATWRDTRQQQWRRRQSTAPIEPESSINVTIGRIEVRAVPADNRKTTSPKRSESPVMPLEDYLQKQRRGGER